MTLLVRVPEAYRLVADFKSIRPGILLLNPDRKKFGSFSLLRKAPPADTARALAAYLHRAAVSDVPLPDDHGGE